MRKQKKESINLCMRIDADVMRRFNAYCDKMGQTKTLAFERIVTAHIDRVEAEEKRAAGKKG